MGWNDRCSISIWKTINFNCSLKDAVIQTIEEGKITPFLWQVLFKEMLLQYIYLNR